MTESHTLTVENLELGYGGRTVVESLDLAVPPGKITTIVGANACGKSTLLRSMSRLLSPRSVMFSWTARMFIAYPRRSSLARSVCCRSHRSHRKG